MQTVLGANGQIAEELTRYLHDNITDDIRLVSRNPAKLHDTDQLFPADLMDAEELEAVAQIVLHHYDRPNSVWFEGKEKPEWTPDILLVQDADVLDHFGVPGIWLTLHWATHKNFTPSQTITEWFTSEYMCSWRREARPRSTSRRPAACSSCASPRWTTSSAVSSSPRPQAHAVSA